MKVDHLTVISLLRREMNWHRNHPGGSGCSESYERGFIVGLKQAQSLVRKAANTIAKGTKQTKQIEK